MHIRRKILEDLRAQLKTLPVFTGVCIQRKRPTRNSYPTITINAESEGVETSTIHLQPRPQERTLIVSVSAWVRGTVDDEKSEISMDVAAESIESILVKPVNATDMALISTDFEVSEDEPDISRIILTFSVAYDSVEFSASI